MTLLKFLVLAAPVLAQETVPVITANMERKLRLPGELAPYQQVSLSARVQGFVEKVEVDRGSAVKTGQLLVLLSAVPIALMTNILRITVTGMAHVTLHDDATKTQVLETIHDFNGWMMMPLGLALLMFELWVFKYLLIEPEKVHQERTHS